MNRINFTLIQLALIIISLTSCGEKRLINDNSIRSQLEYSFNKTTELAVNRSDILFNVFRQKGLTKAEEDGLKFYFASMPLSDLSDYNGQFFLDNIRFSIKARNEFPWSVSIPEDIFLHYVLPIRVNNENLDSFRLKYYYELKSRVADFTDIESAALEVNHWCHEKVSYLGADIRTSGPLATILSSRGRCGEESTLTVAALRTVGIPARQVYVPRWSHSDDNHAWVEVWVNGDWHYLGACEPEPVLDRGWFTEAASRAMLIHTSSFGKYLGSEELVIENQFFSEINNLGKYADTKQIVVRVLDSDHKPVENAAVDFKIFNYAEFYSIARTFTNSDGLTTFKTGKGDLLVWASKNEDYGFKMISAEDVDSVIVRIGTDVMEASSIKFNLNAPVASKQNPQLTKEQRSLNISRLANEDRIRETYISSWIDSVGINDFAVSRGYNRDKIISIVKRSMGNHKEILSFLSEVDKDSKDDAINILNIVSDKDLRDTPSEVFMDHLSNALNYYSDSSEDDLYLKYILNPRIANEIIYPWRKDLQDYFDPDIIIEFKANPDKISEWLNSNLQIDAERNYYNVPITPMGSLVLGVTDNWSRKLLFVAICRSFGIPARLERGTDIPQYYNNGRWSQVVFSDEDDIIDRSASLTINQSNELLSPEYYKHFTLGYFSNGVYKTFTFEYGKALDEFEWPLRLSPGKYVITTGNRLNDSEVLSEVHFFELKSDEVKTIDLEIRNRKQSMPVLEVLTPEKRVYTGKIFESLYDKQGRGMVLAWIEHDREPTKHFLAELRQEASVFDKWGGKVFLISDSASITSSFKIDSDKSLPSSTRIGYDSGEKLLRSLVPGSEQDDFSFPVIFFVNSENEIVFRSEGYQLGLSDQLLTLIGLQKN